jgi:hypothetical protein
MRPQLLGWPNFCSLKLSSTCQDTCFVRKGVNLLIFLFRFLLWLPQRRVVGLRILLWVHKFPLRWARRKGGFFLPPPWKNPPPSLYVKGGSQSYLIWSCLWHALRISGKRGIELWLSSLPLMRNIGDGI